MASFSTERDGGISRKLRMKSAFKQISNMMFHSFLEKVADKHLMFYFSGSEINKSKRTGSFGFTLFKLPLDPNACLLGIKTHNMSLK